MIHPFLPPILGLGFLCIAACAAWGQAAEPQRPGAPTYLRCEYLIDPLAVNTAAPRFGWEVVDPRRGARQSAYEVEVATTTQRLRSGQADAWRSGRVPSDATGHVAYQGRALAPVALYWWRVRTWDGAGRPSPWSRPACFGTGPRKWSAKWVGHPAGPVMDAPAHNGYHSAIVPAADGAQWVAIDLGAVRSVSGVTLWPARPYDFPDTPGFLFPLRYRIEVADEPGFAQPRALVDRTAEDVPGPGTEAVALTFPAARARYVRLLVTRLRAREPGVHAFALAEMEVTSAGANVARGASVSASGSTESGGWSAARLTDGDRVSHPGTSAGEPPPRIRREFAVRGDVMRAVLFVTALGLYEARINGRRVGDRALAPEWTSYHRRLQYQAYDVTGLVRKGANAIGVQLADGWYAGRIGLANIVPGGTGRRIYGDRPLLLAQLHVTTADGRTQVIGTDGRWQSCVTGPLRYADILDGEVVDARLEQPGWDAPGFAGNGWGPARVESPRVGRLVAQPVEPVRVTRELVPVGVTQPSPGVTVVDLGQVMVGTVRLRVQAPRGTVVTVRHAEMLNPDGTLYTANLRGAPQVDRYTVAGSGVETFAPQFTYHGFRYVEVTGSPRPPRRIDVVGRVLHTAAPEVGTFACSDPRLVRLWQNILWTQRGNLVSVPTDCPQRDERLGWTGDIQAFAQTAAFNMDVAAFLGKWLADMRDDQANDGRFPDFAPQPFGPNERFSGAPAWGDAGVIVPWRAWVNYGDRRLLHEHFDAALRWVRFVARTNPDLVWRRGRGNDYNDWLNADTLVLEGWPRTGGAVPNEVFATAFFAHSADLTARMARVLGRTSEAVEMERLHRGVAAAFMREFVEPDGRIQGDTQAGYALALNFDLLPADRREAAVERMVAAFGRYGGHLSTGIQTTHRLMLELSRAGRHDDAYRLVTLDTVPSWGYPLTQGATTIWERWDGYVTGRGFQDPGMNSFNHWALGAVGEWLMRTVIGLSPDEGSPGWKRFVVRPVPGGGLRWAKGSYRSPAGAIEAGWHLEQGAITLDVTVPPGCTAAVHVPCRQAADVTEGAEALRPSRHLRVLPSAAGEAIVEVGGGMYRFRAPMGGK